MLANSCKSRTATTTSLTAGTLHTLTDACYSTDDVRTVEYENIMPGRLFPPMARRHIIFTDLIGDSVTWSPWVRRKLRKWILARSNLALRSSDMRNHARFSREILLFSLCLKQPPANISFAHSWSGWTRSLERSQPQAAKQRPSLRQWTSTSWAGPSSDGSVLSSVNGSSAASSVKFYGVARPLQGTPDM